MKGYEELKERIEAAKIALDDILAVQEVEECKEEDCIYKKWCEGKHDQAVAIAYIIGIVFGFVLTYAIKISISVAWLH